MTASTGSPPFNAPGWTYEFKFNGWRALALMEGKRLRIISQNGTDLLPRFPEFKALAHYANSDALLDGVIVARVETMQSARQITTSGEHFFMAFDVLALNGRALIGEPIENRRAELRRVIHDHGPLTFARPKEDGAALFERANESGWKGVVAKRAGSLYQPGERSQDWVKVEPARLRPR